MAAGLPSDFVIDDEAKKKYRRYKRTVGGLKLNS